MTSPESQGINLGVKPTLLKKADFHATNPPSTAPLVAMHRRISTLVKGASSSSSSPSSYRFEEKQDDDDARSTSSTVVREEGPVPVPSLKIKRVDYYYSRWTKSWKYRNTSSKVTVESVPIIHSTSNDAWKDYSFVIIRTVRDAPPSREPEFKLVVKCGYILKACKDVIKSWPGVSWHADPLELDPEIFITFYPSFLSYAANLQAKGKLTEQDTHLLSSVNLLTNAIASDYRLTLAKLNRLTSHGEITYDLLYAILVPGELMVATCAMTGLPRLFELTSWTRVSIEGKNMYQLNLESIDLIDRPLTKGVVAGRVQTTIFIKFSKGTVRIDSLDAYPFKFHSDEKNLREAIITRGKKWVSLIGLHHMQYEGIAALRCGDKVLRHNVRSRMMVDRSTFRRLNPNYQFPTPVVPKVVENTPVQNNRFNGQEPNYDAYGNPVHLPVTAQNDTAVQTVSPDDTAESVELNDHEILLAPTVVHGFSLDDKAWLEFNVEKIQPVVWNTEAFSNLVLPNDRKELLQSLVEAHHMELGFDDFIKGKGHGLVVNLFGPPGVGKTFSAEATSEHVKRPLYVIGGGDLGTNASALDMELEKIFDVATAWKAIVLIDEADVFLERRSLHDLERNAMVAVFLRHVEYYRGILFLTTNRVKAFDEAFLSRIHVALHFNPLSLTSKVQVWQAFILKMGENVDSFSPEQIEELASRNINGRQIKNAARTAHSLAMSRGQKVSFEHLRITLDAMDEFTREFKKGCQNDSES